MRKPLQRTRATYLTDDELILFDCLWSAGAGFSLLRREFFADEWNRDSHNLDDDQLRDTLHRFLLSGLLTVKNHNGDSSYWMTESGGQEWEAERLPVWDRFARNSYTFPARGKTVLTIYATSENNRDGLWHLGRQVGMFKYAGGPISVTTLHDFQLGSWKRFQDVYRLDAGVSQLPMLIDWQTYEERRT